MSESKKVVIDTEEIGFAQFLSSRYGISSERAEEISDELRQIAEAGTVDGITMMRTSSSEIEVITDPVLEGNIIELIDTVDVASIHDEMENYSDEATEAMTRKLFHDLGLSYPEETPKAFRIGFNRS